MRYIVVYRTIDTEFWEVEAPNEAEAERLFMRQGNMICDPVFEDAVKVRPAKKLVFEGDGYSKLREIG